MSKFNFKNYFETRIIVEDTPVTGDFDTWSPSLRTGVSTRSQTNDVYLFKDIANALHITIPTAVDRVSLSLFNKLFPNNQPNPANTEEEYRDAIFDALTEIVDNINQEAGTNIRNARSQKAYTARIVSALGDTVKTFDGAAPRAVRAAVNRVNQQIVQAAPRAEEPPVPRFTEIQKLKHKILTQGTTTGLRITPEDIKQTFGVADPNNITTTEMLRLYKTTINVIDKRIKSSVNNIETLLLDGSLRYILQPMSIPILPSNGIRGNWPSIHTEDTPRFVFPYDFSVTNKLFSSAGRKFIADLKEKYNVTTDKIYLTMIASYGGYGGIYMCVPLTTIRNRTVMYSEHCTFGTPSKISDRKVCSYYGNRSKIFSLHKFKANLDSHWRKQDMERDLFLVAVN